MKTMSKKLIILFLLLTGVVSISTAQSFNEPVFTSANTTIDFGEVDSKKDAGYRILNFTNTGSAPLLISNIAKSCGCTTPEWPKEAIKPGGKGEIKIAYDITRIGAISKTITITTNEPEGKNADGITIYKQHTIQIKGNVK